MEIWGPLLGTINLGTKMDSRLTVPPKIDKLLSESKIGSQIYDCRNNA